MKWRKGRGSKNIEDRRGGNIFTGRKDRSLTNQQMTAVVVGNAAARAENRRRRKPTGPVRLRGES